jgi:hypothetical protein
VLYLPRGLVQWPQHSGSGDEAATFFASQQ